jgi:hypothetical protein
MSVCVGGRSGDKAAYAFRASVSLPDRLRNQGSTPFTEREALLVTPDID